MANWFEELKEIDKEDKIIHISIMSEFNDVYEFESIDEARNLLDYNFNDGFGVAQGPSFTAWGIKNVYFPTEYDGSEEIRFTPRNPCDFVGRHTEFKFLPSSIRLNLRSNLIDG